MGGLVGFDIHERFQDYNRPRQMAALQTCRAAGFVARPGLIWNIASHVANPYAKWLEWTNHVAWASRSELLGKIAELQDPKSPGISIDFEMYGSLGDKCPPLSRVFEVYCACESLQAVAGTKRIYAYPAVPQFPQNVAIEKRLRDIVWEGQNQFNLARKIDDPVALQRDLDEIVTEGRIYQQWGDGFAPGIDQDLLRDWAIPVQDELARRLIENAWIFLDLSQDDALQFGTVEWRTRPREPIAPPDPAWMGLMAFDVDVSKFAIGPCVAFAPSAGSTAPVFNATVLANVVEEYAPILRRFLRFDGTQGQGFRAGFSRQLSNNYTLAFVGRLPDWRANDGTGWQLGPFRLYVSQSPSARWNWGATWAAADNDRHVVVCEQSVSAGKTKRSILIDGVLAGTSELTPEAQPDGTMCIGNTDGMTSRPCRTELERLTVWEGVDRAKSLDIAKRYCAWHQVRWRGEQ
jgi:hypothetical protein